MQLNSHISSVVAGVYSGLTNQINARYLPELAKIVGNYFEFVSIPESVEDFTSGQGMKFAYGRGQGFVLDSMTLFHDGIQCQAAVGTEDLRDTVTRTAELLEGLGFVLPTSDFKWMYISQIEVQLQPGFSAWLGQFDPLATTIKNKLKASGIGVENYEVWGIGLAGEGPNTIKPGRFLLERREGYPFAQNVFYSEAPLSTHDHIELLQSIEQQFA